MHKPISILVLLSAMLLNACASLPKNSNENTPSTASSATPLVADDGLLEYSSKFMELSAEAQKKELAQINEGLSQNKSDFNYRMKAAIIYAIPASRLRDVNKAQVLLDELIRDKTLDKRRKALAIILKDYMSENSKSVDESNRLLNENNKLSQKVRDEQKRAETLQQRLDDLKTIEKTMADRELGVRK
jgi:uncharacterized phage infection (PIP) family protein YhgE